MRVTIDWLRDHVDLPESAEEIAEALTGSGTNVEEVLRIGDDEVLDLEITTNRPDCLGVIGIARELATFYGRPLRMPSLDGDEAGVPAGDVVDVEIPDLALCSRYTARVVRGVKVGESPAWLRRRLEAVGIRSVSNVVDVSNHVMLEWSQPLHFFDLAKVRGGRIVVRAARPGETITAIDGREYELDPARLVIADGEGAIAIAGVMGGLQSEVSDGTADILIESACFDAVSVRDTSRALGLASESSYRFERFVDHAFVERASLRAARLLAEVAGGQVAPGVVDAGAPSTVAEPVRLRWARIPRILGIDIPRARCLGLFEHLGLEILEQDDEAVVTRAPSWRPDLVREADLIEEVARLHGFDQVPAETTMVVRALTPVPVEKTLDDAAGFLVGAGLHEVVTLSLVGDEVRADPPLWTDRVPLTVRNPVRAGDDRLRRSLLGSLVAIADINRDRGREGIRLFEIGTVFLPVADGGMPDERLVASILVEDDLPGVTGLTEALLRALGTDGDLRREAGDGGGFWRPGHGARILRGDRVVAHVGELHPSLIRHEGSRLALAEVDLTALVPEQSDTVRMVRPSRFPEVRRDLAVVLDESIAWERVRQIVDGVSSESLREVRFFDLYRGKQVGAGKKSLAFTLIYRSDERTLTGAEVDDRVATIVAALEADAGAVLRA